MTRRAEQPEGAQPSQPPEHDRGIRLNRMQLIGVPLLALIPLLAVLDVFGERWDTRVVDGSTLRTAIEFPDRFRAKLSRPITVSVQNRSQQLLDTVAVSFDSTYIERFTAVSFLPDIDDSYVVKLTAVRPGETRRVHLELDGDQVGRHRGRVIVRTGSDSSVVGIHTIVFPE
jgi:hypothetical protein